MSTAYQNALAASRFLVRLARVFNLATGVLIFAAIPASFIFEPLFVKFFTTHPESANPAALMMVLRAWLFLALLMTGAVHIMFTRLLEMIATVRAGDPFVPQNAERLKAMAWALLAVQVLGLSFGVMAGLMNASGSSIDWDFSLTGWIAVALLFVLAGVFEEGARMREDAEAMI
ncbi:MAG TPA: DUF2975 domain-containing protein [Micropepsaceae bacterium]|nr:DUF2975 domain-containing protein [Micropepsaceae bacterium]